MSKRDGLGEKLGRNGRFRTYARGMRRWIKRQTAKKWRRWAKADPEGAPKQPRFRGWAD